MASIVGVDPHEHVLSAVALDERRGVLGNWHGMADELGRLAITTVGRRLSTSGAREPLILCGLRPT